MDTVDVERLGGFAGFGQPGGRLRSRGRIDLAHLAGADRQRLETLFTRAGAAAIPFPDGFRYRMTRIVGGRTETVEVAEHEVPVAVRDCVHDELD